MKIKEIRGMSKEDLGAKLGELKKELVKINAQISTGTTPKSPGQVKQVKKNIAKIITILKEKEIEVDKKIE
jgi:large subunit ribosomal protein L29